MTQPARNTSDPYVSVGHGDAWAAEAAARGSVGTQRLLQVVVTDPDPEVQRALQLDPGEQVVLRSRLILSNNEPVEIATSYYPASLAAESPLARLEKIKGGAVAALAHLGHAPADVVEALTARRPTADEAAQLHVDHDEPVLVLSRTSFDTAGVPIEFAVNVSVSARSTPHVYRLKVSAT